jgi:hypothetical protein
MGKEDINYVIHHYNQLYHFNCEIITIDCPMYYPAITTIEGGDEPLSHGAI